MKLFMQITIVTVLVVVAAQPHGWVIIMVLMAIAVLGGVLAFIGWLVWIDIEGWILSSNGINAEIKIEQKLYFKGDLIDGK